MNDCSSPGRGSSRTFGKERLFVSNSNSNIREQSQLQKKMSEVSHHKIAQRLGGSGANTATNKWSVVCHGKIALFSSLVGGSLSIAEPVARANAAAGPESPEDRLSSQI